jgi:anti-sigma B factor antagonist
VAARSGQEGISLAGQDDDARRLSLDYHLDSDVVVVTVTGELDIATSGLLREGLLRVLTDEHRRGLVVNLAGVTFLDSTGTGVLVGILHRVRTTDGRLAVAAPSSQARRILEIAGLEKVLSIFDSEAQAVQACIPPLAG